MRTSLPVITALFVSVLALQACDKATVIETPPPPVTTSSSEPAVQTVPPAASVVAPVGEIKPDPASVRANSTMTPTQESAAMPLPGQNNDHSVPATPTKAASTP